MNKKDDVRQNMESMGEKDKQKDKESRIDKLKVAVGAVSALAATVVDTEFVQGSISNAVTTCTGCSGHCMTCTFSCGGCDGGCSGGCSSCGSGCGSGCSGGCSGGCRGCGSGCGYSCSGGCSGGCSGCNTGCQDGCKASSSASYSITLNNQGATITGTASVSNQLAEQAMTAITPPGKTGYTFRGYFLEPNGAGTKYYNENGSSAKAWDDINSVGKYNTSSKGTSTATLYAKWEVNTYNINYEPHGGKFKNDVISHGVSESVKSLKGRRKSIAKYTVEAEEIVLEDPLRKGMRFKNWKETVNQ